MLGPRDPSDDVFLHPSVELRHREIIRRDPKLDVLHDPLDDAK
jgi:hypothetical protein